MQMVQSFFVWVTLHSQKQTTDQLRRVYTEHLNLWQHIIPCSELISHHFMGITIIHGFITRMWTKICSCGTFVKANYKLWFLRSIHQRPIYTRRFVSPIRQGPIYTRGFVGAIRQKLFHTRGFVGPIHQRPIYTRGFVGPIRRKLTLEDLSTHLSEADLYAGFPSLISLFSGITRMRIGQSWPKSVALPQIQQKWGRFSPARSFG